MINRKKSYLCFLYSVRIHLKHTANNNLIYSSSQSSSRNQRKYKSQRGTDRHLHGNDNFLVPFRAFIISQAKYGWKSNCVLITTKIFDRHWNHCYLKASTGYIWSRTYKQRKCFLKHQLKWFRKSSHRNME